MMTQISKLKIRTHFHRLCVSSVNGVFLALASQSLHKGAWGNRLTRARQKIQGKSLSQVMGNRWPPCRLSRGEAGWVSLHPKPPPNAPPSFKQIFFMLHTCSAGTLLLTPHLQPNVPFEIALSSGPKLGHAHRAPNYSLMNMDCISL
jgi:hypothetical protein